MLMADDSWFSELKLSEWFPSILFVLFSILIVLMALIVMIVLIVTLHFPFCWNKIHRILWVSIDLVGGFGVFEYYLFLLYKYLIQMFWIQIRKNSAKQEYMTWYTKIGMDNKYFSP